MVKFQILNIFFLRFFTISCCVKFKICENSAFVTFQTLWYFRLCDFLDYMTLWTYNRFKTYFLTGSRHFFVTGFVLCSNFTRDFITCVVKHFETGFVISFMTYFVTNFMKYFATVFWQFLQQVLWQVVWHLLWHFCDIILIYFVTYLMAYFVTDFAYR